LVERREAPQLEVAQPVDATKSISRDPSYDWIIELKDGRKISAIDIQRMYLEKAQQYCDRSDPEVSWLLEEWERILNDLEVDFMRCIDRIDWVAKKYLLNTFQESEKLDWTDPWLQSIDLEYHNIAWEQGLYYELVRENQIRRILKEDEIKTAIFMPPDTTRAYFRGRSVARFNSQINAIHWDEVVFDQNSSQRRVAFNHASDDDRIEQLNTVIREASNYEDFLLRLEKFDQ
jgi:Pup amidohydrolase